MHNPRTYPVLLRLFAELGVATQPSEMSMSIKDDDSDLEWAGALGRRGLFPTSANLRKPRYLAMLVEIPRFHRQAKALLSVESDTRTLREFLADGRFSAYFVRHFMEPVVACVWSCEPEVSLDYPARYLFTFLEHHGMLGIFGSPQWRTVTGGSPLLRRRRSAPRCPTCALGAKVTSVLETADGVEVTDGSGDVATYDAVVIATHPGHALSMLAEPTALQRELLSAMPYSPNTALLHTDASLLPEAADAWASWNFRRPGADVERPTDDGVIVTYDLTRLQRLDTETHYLVTLGGADLVDPATVIDRMEYEHPLYNPVSVAAQARLPEIDTDRVVFAGAYHGWGFHEDGARSGLAAVTRLGLEWPAGRRGRRPAGRRTGVYDTTISHTRRAPFKRRFTPPRPTPGWSTSTTCPTTASWAASRRATTSATPDTSIRANVRGVPARSHDVEIGTGKVFMAAQARAFGYCFNPISVFWCHDESGALAATVVEVHNTYGDRHAYLVHTDDQGRATTPKAMYVSPFHGTDGTYELAVPAPTGRPAAGCTSSSSSTSDGGDARSAPRWSADPPTPPPLRAAPAALRGSLLIRVHGIWLWLRRLPVRPRPTHAQQGVQR